MMTRRTGQRGFTIVELMIATLVFSLVLIVITVGVLSFTKAFYQGINQSNTQEAARSIVETISQAIQFTGDPVTAPGLDGPNNSKSFCIGNQHYSYLLNKQLTDESTVGPNQSRHVLALNTGAACDTIQAQNMTANPAGTELLPPNMRLTKLSVQQVGTTDSYRVTVRIVFGDDDLLDNLNTPTTKCKVSISGSQYCAMAELTTVVKQRVNH